VEKGVRANLLPCGYIYINIINYIYTLCLKKPSCLKLLVIVLPTTCMWSGIQHYTKLGLYVNVSQRCSGLRHSLWLYYAQFIVIPHRVIHHIPSQSTWVLDPHSFIESSRAAIGSEFGDRSNDGRQSIAVNDRPTIFRLINNLILETFCTNLSHLSTQRISTIVKVC